MGGNTPAPRLVWRRNLISVTLEFRVAPSKQEMTASTIRRRETQLAQKELLRCEGPGVKEEASVSA